MALLRSVCVLAFGDSEVGWLAKGHAVSQTEAMPALALEMPGMAGFGTHVARRPCVTNSLGREAQALSLTWVDGAPCM